MSKKTLTRIGFWLLGIGVILAFVGYCFTVPQSQSLTCKWLEPSDRSPTCEFTKETFGGTETQEFELQGSKIEQFDKRSGGETRTDYRVVLRTSRGDLPLVHSEGGRNPFNDRINKFVRNEEAPPLTWDHVQIDDTQLRWQFGNQNTQQREQGYFFGIIFVVTGLFIILISIIFLLVVIVIQPMFRQR